MLELEEEAIFVTPARSMRVEANGGPDLLTLRNLTFDPEVAATLAWLANQGEDVDLKIEIKIHQPE